MQLSVRQKREIYENGFVRIPGVVPGVMVDAALRAINGSLGQNGIDPERLPIFRSQSYCPELQGEPVIRDLFNKTPAFELAESATEPGKLKPVGGGQVALRFPSAQDPPNPPRPHLDGMYSPTNGVPEGEIHNFTMLAGIFLSDVTEDYAGNFTVWPGTHHLFEGWFRKHGPESLLDGMPKVTMPEPLQVKCRAGDLVLCHYQLAHGAAPNVSPHTRYAIFFRLTHADHAGQKFETMTDLWREWPGVREAVEMGGQ
jgi:ectoine hydroxylase-related dioxygenase (phytanoyl-CoA dioxygenase family)